MTHHDDDSHHQYDVLLTDPDLRTALSNIGVFVSDYTTGRSVPSRLWLDQGLAENDTGADLDWLEQVHPDDRERVAAAVNRVIAGEIDSFDEVFRFRRPDGAYRWVVTRGTSVTKDEDGKAAFFIGLDIDISRFKSVEHQLQRQNDQLDTLQDIVAVIGASLNLEETVHRILEETKRILPYDTATVQLLEDGRLHVIGCYGFAHPDEIMTLSFPHPERGSLSTAAIDSRSPCLSANVVEDFPALIQPDPEHPIVSWMGIPLIRHDEVFGLMALDSYRENTYTEEHRRLAGTVGVHIALALENARLHDETYEMAMSDTLTGAGSRRRFQVEGRLLYEKAQREGSSVCALMLDIDHFKAVNDRFGHDTGDVILKRIAAACMDVLRGSDVFARYGGEEFVILLPGSANQDGQQLGQRMCDTIRTLYHEEIDQPVTVSIGVACEVPARGNDLDTLVHRADTALYQAKSNGRDQVVVGEPVAR
ncbi:MAG: diguanylate cyclase [Spirochaeta sp.]|nr:diguanylate cyclase [Spirochaeta sp.]